MNEIIVPPEAILYFQETLLILKALATISIGMLFAIIGFIAPEDDSSGPS